MSASIIVESRFAGPPGSANGGYLAGRLAQHVAADFSDVVTVTLRRPPPLEIAMQVEKHDELTVVLDGELIAEGKLGAFARDLPAAIAVDDARAAEVGYRGLSDHPFPGCFVCGTARDVGDGLRLRPGPTEPGKTACVWTVDGTLGPSGSAVTSEFVWSALDCPGGWTSDLQARPLVLGRMTASVQRLPRPGDDIVVVGALHNVEGRKHTTMTAAYDVEGALVGRAEQVWIALT